MYRTLTTLAVGLAIGVAARAATTNTKLTVNATGSVAAAGTANLTNIGNGTFAGSASLGSLAGTTVTAPFTITLSDGTLSGSLSIPVSLIASNAASGTGSALITGGTGAYAGATGSLPS